MLFPCLATAQADVEPKLGTRNSSKRPIRSLVTAIDFLAKESACPPTLSPIANLRLFGQ
jgi:hypothetical protein